MSEILLDTKSDNPIPAAEIKAEMAAKAQAERETEKAAAEKSTDAEKSPFLPLTRRMPAIRVNSAEFAEHLQKYIAENQKTGIYPTPWATLNTMLDGGFKRGEFVILGGVTNLGKTAMALQIADFIAANGKRVLFYSLEMPAAVLISRTLARIGFELGFDYPASSYANGFASADAYAQTGARYLSALGNRLTFISGQGSALSTGDVWRDVEKIISETGEPPLVIIDYFQILKSVNAPDKALDKEKVDAVVFELKQTAVNLGVPILAISTLNRDSYNRPLTISAYKESGSIEYTADVALVLNTFYAEKHPAKPSAKPEEMPEFLFQKELADFKKGNVILKILKNRNSGGKGEILMVTEPLKERFTEGSFGNAAGEFYSMGESIGGAGAGFGQSAEVLSAQDARRQRLTELQIAKKESELIKLNAQINKLAAETQKIKSQTSDEFLKDDAAPLAVVLPALPLPNGNPPWRDD